MPWMVDQKAANFKIGSSVAMFTESWGGQKGCWNPTWTMPLKSYTVLYPFMFKWNQWWFVLVLQHARKSFSCFRGWIPSPRVKPPAKKISTFLTQAIASADKQTNRPESESVWRRYRLRPASSYLGNPQRERRKAIEQIPFLATHILGPKSAHPISRSVDTFGGREAAGVI